MRLSDDWLKLPSTLDVYERNKYFYSKCHSHFITRNGLKYRKFVISYKAFKPERILSKASGWNLAAISKGKMKIETRQLSQSLLCISTSKKVIHTSSFHIFKKKHKRGKTFIFNYTNTLKRGLPAFRCNS